MSINKKEFITNYILSLKERTRNEKGKVKFGFDWIIYQLQLQKGEYPIRLPFIRSEKIEEFKTKTEPEFGVDLSFLNKAEKILSIFVLKDEALQYKNWISKGFDSDLRRASCPDLKGLDLFKVRIILAYNKDEDDAGIKSFEDFSSSNNKTIGENVILSFERWNISRIVEEIENHLFTPDLLPQHLSGILSYLCSQINDFDYKSDEWQKQLIPNWKRFLNTIFKDTIDESRINIVSIALIILHQHKKDSKDSEIGWIDLIEWSTLFLWSLYRKIENTKLKAQIQNFWILFYLTSLNIYYEENKSIFKVEHGIRTEKVKLSHLSALNDSILAFDFISKFGVMTLGTYDILLENEKDDFIKEKADELSNLITLNPSALRPLLDINHLQLYIIWLIFYFANKSEYIGNWLLKLENYLMTRRIGNVIPFIEGRNRIDLVVEFTVTGNKPYEYIDNASYLLMLLLEIALGLKIENGETLTKRLFKHVVLGYGDDNKLITKEEKPIDLQSWIPPDDWDERIFLDKVVDGVNITSANFFIGVENIEQLDSEIKNFVIKNIEKFSNKIREDIPLAVYLLACIKNNSPLPPFFWRVFLYKDFMIKKENDKNNIK